MLRIQLARAHPRRHEQKEAVMPSFGFVVGVVVGCFVYDCLKAVVLWVLARR